MQKNTKKTVYMVGPSFKTQGGISSVLSTYRANFAEALNLRFISSYSGDLRAKDFIWFASSLIRVLLTCIMDKGAVFHIHSSTDGSYLRKSILARMCLFFGKRTIFHIHGADFDEFIENAKPGKKQKIIQLLNRVDRVVVLSDSWYLYFSKYVKPDRLRVIYNPSECIMEEYIEKVNPDPTVKVLFMGRMGERKGTYDLIKAVSMLKNKNFVVEIYGDGDEEKIKALVKKEKLEAVVKISGWVEHSRVFQLYDNADLLVLPSYAEGLPMAVLEALGRGLPIISTTVGGIPEAVLDGVNGFLIKPGDIDALSQRLDFLIGNRELREQMGRESLKLAWEKFSPAVIKRQLEELY